MKIRALQIENFKAIKNIEINNLTDIVVIAGQNGCGKSSILDAIRLLKSFYGGHHNNEWHQWFGEFQINIHSSQKDVKNILGDHSREATINIEFILCDSEKNYLQNNIEDLLKRKAWKTVIPEHLHGNLETIIPNQEYKHFEPQIEAYLKRTLPEVEKELYATSLQGKLKIFPDGNFDIYQSALLNLCFSSYEPENIGIIDYHSSTRTYNRENISSINLNLSESQENYYKNHALYNSIQKYQNIKQEIASTYIKNLLIKESAAIAPKDNLIETLQDLFKTFFPGKIFLGPKPNNEGKLTFPVRLENGLEHDINELSSGEKEIVYGYLRLHNTSPKNSILLLDEPELHLNPRLLKGLVGFYKKHLSKINDNQIWLITHSDTILRDAIDDPECSIFHMKSIIFCDYGDQQISRISANSELQIAISDIVGDLSTFTPNSKLIILEGGGNSDFDVKFVSELFPELLNHANLLPGENKEKVKKLQETLNKAHSIGAIPLKVFSITDKDNSSEAHQENQFSWDVYHIENYLINATYIHRALKDLFLEERYKPKKIEDALKESAKSSVKSLIEHEMRSYIHSSLTKCINLSIDPQSDNYSDEFKKSIETSISKITLVNERLSMEAIQQKEAEITQKFMEDLENDQWKFSFRGRDILTRFTGSIGTSLRYEQLRNLIIAKMREDGYKPDGMKITLNKIMGH